jgi:outer membrane protein assembly factor BamE (lipoprotein component of BamABCDE complex)
MVFAPSATARVIARSGSKAIAVATLCVALLAGCAGGAIRLGEVHTADQLARIHAGMTRDEVLGIAGPPDSTMPFSASRTESWDYRYYDPWGYLALFSVTFGSDGRAVSTISARLNDGGDHGG